MKKLMMMLIFVLGIGTTHAQLNDTALRWKNNNAALYHEAVAYAKHKWNDDHVMIVHEINEQMVAAEYIKQLIDAKKLDEEIFFSCLEKWETEFIVDPKFYDPERDSPYSDRVMVTYCYKQQIKAKNSY